MASEPGYDLPKVSDQEHSDPAVERVIDQIRTRQWATVEKFQNLTPGDMAFGLMRQIPRDKWNTPLTEMGHWPRGSTISEIKENKILREFTPAQAILKLFEMDDALKARKAK